MADLQDKIAQVAAITDLPQDQAQSLLENAGGEVEAAVNHYLAVSSATEDINENEMDELEEPAGGPTQGVEPTTAPSSTPFRGAGFGGAGADGADEGAGRTLTGAPAEPMPETWRNRGGGGGSSRAAAGSTRGTSSRFGTFKDLVSSAPPRGGPRPADDDDEEDADENQPQNFFAGGERSGLSVENPNARGGPSNLVKELLRKAAEGGTREPKVPVSGSSTPSSAFSGSGNVLGSEDVPSSFVPDPTSRPPTNLPAGLGGVPGAFPGALPEGEDGSEDEPAERRLTFWRDGFTLEDGELMRYDVPENQAILEALQSGRAPRELLNVKFGQPVTMMVENRRQEEYKPPPKKPSKPFSGSGNRLGSPTASLPSTPSASAAPAQPSSSGAPAAAARGTVFEVDQTQPTTRIQVRLADGQRVPILMNHEHTVGDIRRYIASGYPSEAARQYTLQTTFPNRELGDDSVTLKDANVLGSVIVQKYV